MNGNSIISKAVVIILIVLGISILLVMMPGTISGINSAKVQEWLLNNGYVAYADSSGNWVVTGDASIGGNLSVTGNIEANKWYVVSVLPSDHSWSGTLVDMTAGTNLALGNICYIGSDGKLEKAIATASTTMPAICIVTESITENAAGTVLLSGFFRDDTWNWTPGGFIYADNVTAGGLTQTIPSSSGNQVQIVGIALTADIAKFDFNLVTLEIE